MSDAPDDIDQLNHVRRSDHGVSITTEIKRGTGTRDQDKHVIKAKGETFDEAAHYHRQALAYLDGGTPVADPPILNRVRDFQPVVDDGDGNGDDPDGSGGR